MFLPDPGSRVKKIPDPDLHERIVFLTQKIIFIHDYSASQAKVFAVPYRVLYTISHLYKIACTLCKLKMRIQIQRIIMFLFFYMNKNKKHILSLHNMDMAQQQAIVSRVADPGCLSRIPDVYPGSRIRIFSHPGSRIQKQQQKRGVEKKFLSYLFM
jgi:hypothetical protein